MDLPVRVNVLDGLHHGGGHASAHGEAPAHAGALVHLVLGIGLELGEVDVRRVEDAQHLLKGEDEVHVGADGPPVGLQLLGGAGPDEDHLGVRVVLLHHPGGDDHGGQGHGDVIRELGVELFRHDAPGGAAAGAHPGLLGRDLLQEVVGLLHGAEIGADGDLHHVVEAQHLHGGVELGGGGVLAELAHEGRGHAGDDLLIVPQGLADLIDLALVGDGAEGAVHQAHAAGDALVIVDLGPAQLVGLDGVHAAGGGAGPLDLADGPVGALVEALAAFDALFLVYVTVLVLVHVDGVLGADVHAGVGDAALAVVRDAQLLGGAGVAGEGDDVHQGVLEVLLRLLGGTQVLTDGDGLPGVADVQSQGQPDPLLDDGPLQEDVRPVMGHVALDHLQRNLVQQAGVPSVEGQPGHLFEYGAANVVHRAVHTSHSSSSLFFQAARPA